MKMRACQKYNIKLLYDPPDFSEKARIDHLGKTYNHYLIERDLTPRLHTVACSIHSISFEQINLMKQRELKQQPLCE